MQDNSAYIVNTLTPAGTAGAFLGVSHRANKFYVIDASGEFLVKTDNSSQVPFKQGQGRTFVSDFNRLELENISSNPISIRLWVGNGEYKDQRFQLLESSTEFIASPVSSIAGAVSEVFNGVPLVNQITRKAIIVSNNDSSNNLELRDESGNSGVIVFPKTSVMIPTSDYVEVYNPTGGAIATRISEIWYVT
jgi:hypothetical protein